MKSARLAMNFLSRELAAFMVSCHLTLSLPKKSNLTSSSVILMCSRRSVVAPTVSASSGSFSSPTLIAVRYIR